MLRSLTVDGRVWWNSGSNYSNTGTQSAPIASLDAPQLIPPKRLRYRITTNEADIVVELPSSPSGSDEVKVQAITAYINITNYRLQPHILKEQLPNFTTTNDPHGKLSGFRRAEPTGPIPHRKHKFVFPTPDVDLNDHPVGPTSSAVLKICDT